MQLRIPFPPRKRRTKDEVQKAAREVKTLAQLLPGPSGPHEVHPPDDPWESIGYTKSDRNR